MRRPGGAGRRGIGAAVLAAAWAAVPAAAPAQVFDKLLEAGEKAAEVAGKAGAALPIGAEEETAIGRGVAATLAGYYTLDRDTALTAYVNLVGLAVAASGPRPDVRYRFGVLDTEQVNAMATPGGYVFVTRGALALMESEAELAGVLAHEVGHVNEKHVIEEIQDRARTELGTDLAGEALGADPEALDKVVGLGTNVLFLGLSREDELEADSLGVVYAEAAGYDPAGLAAFVRKLEANESRPFLKSLKATHPDPSDRLELIERVVKKAAADREAAPVLAERFRASVSASP
jgi:predicted Zn-dependent protease